MSTIEKRGENSYRLTVSCGYDKEGKQIVKRKTIDVSDISLKKRPSEAKRQYTLFQEEIKKGLYVDNTKITFGEFVDKWLIDYANVNLQPKTLLEYNRLLKRIVLAIGHIKLIQLQPTHLTAFYNNLRENGAKLNKKYVSKKAFIEIISKSGFKLNDIAEISHISQSVITSLKSHEHIQPSTALKISKALGIRIDLLFDEIAKDEPLSEKTILHHHRLISSILASALQWGFIITNPALRVKAPKVPKKEARYYNIEETEYILQLIESEPIKYRTMITLAIYGGMRLGELTALKWDDIDLNNRLININKALQHLPGQDTFLKTTKTENTRVISLPKSAITLLCEYKLWQNGEKAKLDNLWHDNNQLFTAIDGTFIFPDTISKWFLKFIRKHNEAIKNDDTIAKEDKPKYILREVNFHGLRHTSASILINQNLDVTTLSKRLGHARTSTTMDIYSHSLQKADMTAADKFENLFNKKNENDKQG